MSEVDGGAVTGSAGGATKCGSTVSTQSGHGVLAGVESSATATASPQQELPANSIATRPSVSQQITDPRGKALPMVMVAKTAMSTRHNRYRRRREPMSKTVPSPFCVQGGRFGRMCDQPSNSLSPADADVMSSLTAQPPSRWVQRARSPYDANAVRSGAAIR